MEPKRCSRRRQLGCGRCSTLLAVVVATLCGPDCMHSEFFVVAQGEVLSGPFNVATGQYATIAGGYSNTVSGDAAVVTGGNKNTVAGGHAIIGGGWYNTASGEASVIGGGWHNTATEMRSTVGGGGGNKAFGSCSTVAGGRHNYASGYGSTVAGGGADDETKTNGHMASGLFSSVLGGHDNTASGDYSVAVGKKVRVSHANAAAIGLAPSLDTPCESVADSSLNICVENGLYVNGVLVDMEGVAALLQQQAQDIEDLKAAVAALQDGKAEPVKFVPTAKPTGSPDKTTTDCNWWGCS